VQGVTDAPLAANIRTVQSRLGEAVTCPATAELPWAPAVVSGSVTCGMTTAGRKNPRDANAEAEWASGEECDVAPAGRQSTCGAGENPLRRGAP
jgi:hypothetical protein